MYQVAERESRHPGMYVTWKHRVNRAKLEWCQAELDSYLDQPCEETRSGCVSASGGGSRACEMPVVVARCFRELGRMVLRTEVEIITAYRAMIENENYLCVDGNSWREA